MLLLIRFYFRVFYGNWSHYVAYSRILVSIYQCTYLSGLRIMSEIFFSGLRVAATWILLLLLLLAVDLLVDALCWLLPEVRMLVDSQCFDDGNGSNLPGICTFTLRPMSGPFALITLVLEKRHECYWDEYKLIHTICVILKFSSALIT